MVGLDASFSSGAKLIITNKLELLFQDYKKG
ncbi:hypothetical protein RDI58_018783 [Solanum bulbocastanum]|uniref:Uncharacterized protein n=1 Tax=Solanum bulbocastanum TaxID=147425 RepID=A0AAN8TB90_SOLBU